MWPVVVCCTAVWWMGVDGREMGLVGVEGWRGRGWLAMGDDVIVSGSIVRRGRASCSSWVVLVWLSCLRRVCGCMWSWMGGVSGTRVELGHRAVGRGGRGE